MLKTRIILLQLRRINNFCYYFQKQAICSEATKFSKKNPHSRSL